MFSRFSKFAVLFLLALPAPILQTPPAYAGGSLQAKRAITVDDYFTQADIFQIAVSPDGEHVAYTEGRWQKSTDDRRSELWIVPTAKGDKLKDPQRLTFDRGSYRSPQWSPDSRWIYVLGNRKREGEKQPPFNGRGQVWRIARAGEIVPVTQLESGVEAYELCRHAHALLYLVHVTHQDEDWKDLREKFPGIEYGQGVSKTSQIWKLDLGSYRAEKLIDAGRYIHEFTMSRDGKRLAMITAPDDKVVSFEGKSRIDVWEAGKITTLPDDVWRKKAPSPYAWLEKLAWSAEGDELAFNAVFDGYPVEIVVTEWKDDHAKSFVMDRPKDLHVRGYGSPLTWFGPNLYFLGEKKAGVQVWIADHPAGDGHHMKLLTNDDAVVEAFSMTPADSKHHVQVALLADPQHLADIYFLGDAISFAQRRLTNVNPQADAWKWPQMKIVSWKGAGGTTVEGILELPPDYKPGTKVPLVVVIHGGPTTAIYLKRQFWIYGRTLLPAKGYAVLCPNYRGSTGYGDKFTTDLIGRENDIEVEDILKGVDSLVDAGIADPDRLAVSGWSNGGYLTNCLITKTTRFKAAISGAGIVDAVMEFGANDEPAYAIVFKQGFPWNNPEKYHKASSTYQLDKIRTPTLIHVGGNDDRCPIGHSKLLFRALKEYLNVPTQLCVYPGEEHGLMKYRNRQAKMEWDLAWLERYVMGKKKTK